MKIVVTKKNESHLYIDAEIGILYELADFFCFYAHNYKFHPLFKSKRWDGKIRLFNTNKCTLPVGLFNHLREFANARGYELTTEISDRYGMPNDYEGIDGAELATFFNKYIKLSSKGKAIEPRDYQVEAALKAINEKRLLILSPTASGKSLIIYMMMRWFLQEKRKPVLVVVPTTSLVEQMSGDFVDYSEFDEGFDREDIQLIYSGKEKHNITCPVVVSTWQSIYKMGSSWFQQFGMIVGDEAHSFKAKSLTAIMDACTEAQYRIGTTGTLDGTAVHKMVLEGMFGPVHKAITTKQLMDRGDVADLKVKVLMLEYTEEQRKLISVKKTRHTYPEEIKFLTSHAGRNKFIKNLATSLEGNTLLLFNYVDSHGKPLYNMIKEKIEVTDPGRKVFYVSGETAVQTREDIRTLVEKEKDAIIVASLGTFSTGINIRNLHNIIFGSPSKSQIKVLQSIGRGLRKSDDGRHTTLYDIADDLHWKQRKNYTLNHASERVMVYNKELFDYKLIKVKLDG